RLRRSHPGLADAERLRRNRPRDKGHRKMRDNQLKTMAALGAVALAAASPGPVSAKDVKTDVDGKFFQLPEGAKNNLDAVRVLIAAANGLGMARVATWQNDITENDGSRMCVGCTTDMYEYK